MNWQHVNVKINERKDFIDIWSMIKRLKTAYGGLKDKLKVY
ncbi:hypothetical protein B4146_2823 [Bacillus subtilis]|uniref:Uncharacterized protein n=1 Tax=Bacillus subtilis TaxID=1423 RepID=A0AAP1E698_BACIU|nr:hypothetical protein B4146_2823 [Bacillus subtilis]KZD88627.1 hypothetical protein B4122_4052 [Bacillus subtilis]KZD91921.1 hypothetical protein B4122_2563 [Bacillus subtilis]